MPHVAEQGVVLVSLPSVVHWSVRGQIALGRFEYTSKGLLDREHLRFFTRASAKRLFACRGARGHGGEEHAGALGERHSQAARRHARW